MTTKYDAEEWALVSIFLSEHISLSAVSAAGGKYASAELFSLNVNYVPWKFFVISRSSDHFFCLFFLPLGCRSDDSFEIFNNNNNNNTNAYVNDISCWEKGNWLIDFKLRPVKKIALGVRILALFPLTSFP